jgi:hypothetical protein
MGGQSSPATYDDDDDDDDDEYKPAINQFLLRVVCWENSESSGITRLTQRCKAASVTMP